MSNNSTIPTPATPDVCTVAILIEGKEISSQYHLLGLVVNREVNRVPSATLQFQDGEASRATFAASNTDTFLPGKNVEIQLGYRSQNSSVFKGLIIRHGIKIRKGGSILEVECYHPAVKMTCGVKSRYQTDKKDSEILEDILRANNLQGTVDSTVPDLKEIVQYNSTDWDFMLCRAEANGLLVIVGDDKVTVAKPATGSSPAVTIQYGATVLELDAVIDARWQNKGIMAESWSAADQGTVDASAQEPSTPRSGNLTAATLADVIGGDPLVVRHTGNLGQPELQALADARLMKERLARIRGRAKCQGIASVLPGTIVEVTGIGERFQGSLYVSGVRHTVSGGNWETDVQFGLDPGLFADTYNIRPQLAAGLLPAVSGLQIGIATQLGNDPDGEHRIKVRLPLISATDDGIWARIATLDAGDTRGTFFRPEIGDEVVVGFLNDDPRHPIVLGMCHSSAKPSPEAPEDSNKRKGYFSREKMKFVFDDEKKSVQLETPAGNKLTLSEDAQEVKLEDQNGNSLTLDQNGVTIESAKNLKLKAAQDITIEGLNVESKAQSAFKAGGTGSAEVSGAMTTIKGSATTVIQGGIVQIN